MQVCTERKDMAYFVQCRKRTFRHVWKLFFEKTDIDVIDFYTFNLYSKLYIAVYLYYRTFLYKFFDDILSLNALPMMYIIGFNDTLYLNSLSIANETYY